MNLAGFLCSPGREDRDECDHPGYHHAKDAYELRDALASGHACWDGDGDRVLLLYDVNESGRFGTVFLSWLLDRPDANPSMKEVQAGTGVFVYPMEKAKNFLIEDEVAPLSEEELAEVMTSLGVKKGS